MPEIKNYNCHDCDKEIKLDGEKIKNGKFLVYKDGGEKINILKCNECYEKDKSLSNYKKTEVYSRIVGYLRPVQQWNIGKQQEFKDRVVYKN